MHADPFGLTLLTIARNAIEKHYGIVGRPVIPHPALSNTAATFVTLTQADRLRGCIGSLEACRPLAQDVAENASSAAFRDPRFTPLAADELKRTLIEVSLLDTPEAIAFTDEADALGHLRPGLDGIILTHGSRRATFLPQVWESLPEPERFMTQLKLKAGLPAYFWDAGITLARYGVQKWKET